MLTTKLCKDLEYALSDNNISIVRAQDAQNAIASNASVLDADSVADLITAQMIQCPYIVAKIATLLSDNVYTYVEETLFEDAYIELSEK